MEKNQKDTLGCNILLALVLLCGGAYVLYLNQIKPKPNPDLRPAHVSALQPYVSGAVKKLVAWRKVYVDCHLPSHPADSLIGQSFSTLLADPSQAGKSFPDKAECLQAALGDVPYPFAPNERFVSEKAKVAMIEIDMGTTRVGDDMDSLMLPPSIKYASRPRLVPGGVQVRTVVSFYMASPTS